jgi:hypothetical protein
MLWMQKNKPECYDDSVVDQARVQTGNEVGDLAMGYFGDYVEVPYDRENYAGMVEQTQQLLARGVPTICEATFAYRGNLCMVDILRVRADGVDIIEVKSASEYKPEYLDDMAYQCWVLEHCGLTVETVSLMHLNKKYVRSGELDLQELFVLDDRTEEVRAMQDSVSRGIETLQRILADPDEPNRRIGEQCFKPHECGFRSWCWRDVPAPCVFDIRKIGPAKLDPLFDRGIVSFEDARAHSEQFTSQQLMQIYSYLDDLPPHIDKESIRDFLSQLRLPLYFLDFETFGPAIPPFDGVKPYQQIPSQYSLHIVHDPDREPEHREFLATEGTDPRRAVAERLCADIAPGACTVAYHAAFEKTVLRGLAKAFPDLAIKLTDIADNMYDLEDPFRNGWYYDKAMGGSSSIKVVLPALFPDDPELDYTRLDGIHDGTGAMEAFARLCEYPPAERAAIRAQLLAYCRLDTLAMVRIWQKLREVTARTDG